MSVRERLTGGFAGTRAGLAVDVALGAVFAAALAFQSTQLARVWGGDSWQFTLAAGTVVCALALVRRRNRAWAVTAGLAVAAIAVPAARLAELPSEPSPAMALGLAVLVGSAVRALPALQAAAVAAGGLAVAVGGLLAAVLASATTGVATLNSMALLAAVTTALGLRLLAARRRTIAEQARRDERLALARELHDVAAHHITSIVLMAQAAPITARTDPDAAAASFADIETAGADALAATRRVVGLLRDTDDTAPATVATPGAERLADLVERFAAHGPAVRLRLPDGEPEWPPEIASTVHRVVQEALTNVARHAPRASAVTVTLTHDRQAVTVEVADDGAPDRRQHGGSSGAPSEEHDPDGRGHRVPAEDASRDVFDVFSRGCPGGLVRGVLSMIIRGGPIGYARGGPVGLARDGYGLLGMRERVEALGGTLHAGPQPSAGGWSVRATLPLPPSPQRARR